MSDQNNKPNKDNPLDSKDYVIGSSRLSSTALGIVGYFIWGKETRNLRVSQIVRVGITKLAQTIIENNKDVKMLFEHDPGYFKNVFKVMTKTKDSSESKDLKIKLEDMNDIIEQKGKNLL